MTYAVRFHADFISEWKALDVKLKELAGEVLDHLEEEGPFLGRPEVDTLNASKHANMKEIRVKHGRQVWRFVFAFDPRQNAIILCGADKQGINEARFYRQLIAKADERFDSWLKEMTI
ncbi:type II toxin-antitoxin system RelE/ParE family toxin [Agrobacterium rosae]|uniref:type II toxin-antitoxin system RelE/ParE family toxin n=1 Tax=Agrobacterium rosae TaxID=1972867 RepID=UPI003BA0DE34